MKTNRGIHAAWGTVSFSVVGKAGKLEVMPGIIIFPKIDFESKPDSDLENPRTRWVSHMVLSNLAANPGLTCKSIVTCSLRTLLFIYRQWMSGCPTWSELPANLEVITMGVSQGQRTGLFGYEFLSWWPWKMCFLPIPVSMLDTYVRVRVPGYGSALWGEANLIMNTVCIETRPGAMGDSGARTQEKHVRNPKEQCEQRSHADGEQSQCRWCVSF